MLGSALRAMWNQSFTLLGHRERVRWANLACLERPVFLSHRTKFFMVIFTQTRLFYFSFLQAISFRSFWDVCERKGKQWRSLTSALSAGGPVSSTTSEWSEFNSKPRVKAFWLLSGGVLLTGHWWTCRDKILIRIIMVQLNELNILCKAYTHNDKFMISTFTLRFLFVSDRLVPRLVKSKTKWSFFPELNDQKLTCYELMGWGKKSF